MSDTASEKEPYDNYPTPQPLADACVKRVEEIFGDITNSHVLVEPSAGNGAFVRPMRSTWPSAIIVSVELRPEEQSLRDSGSSYIFTQDWVNWVASARFDSPVLCIGNPPFSLAQQHLEAAFANLPTKSSICLLLRLSFFGGKDRNIGFWLKNGGLYLKYLSPIAPRPSFIRGTSDNSEYGLFIWEIGYQRDATILDPILWEKRRNVRPKS